MADPISGGGFGDGAKKRVTGPGTVKGDVEYDENGNPVDQGQANRKKYIMPLIDAAGGFLKKLKGE